MAGTSLPGTVSEQDHPFGPDRFHVFWKALVDRGLESAVCKAQPVLAERAAIERFHTPEYVDEVIQRSRDGSGLSGHGRHAGVCGRL